MPRTKANPKQKPKPSVPARNGTTTEVLTLAEAAIYLRLPEENVARLVHTQGLPGRQVGEEWRFLKTALQDWLRCAPPASVSKEAVPPGAVPSWDDPMEIEYRKELSRIRGRDLFEGL